VTAPVAAARSGPGARCGARRRAPWDQDRDGQRRHERRDRDVQLHPGVGEEQRRHEQRGQGGVDGVGDRGEGDVAPGEQHEQRRGHVGGQGADEREPEPQRPGPEREPPEREAEQAHRAVDQGGGQDLHPRAGQHRPQRRQVEGQADAQHEQRQQRRHERAERDADRRDHEPDRGGHDHQRREVVLDHPQPLDVPRTEPVERVVDAREDVGEHGGVAADEVGRVQVPALHEPVTQRVADVGGVPGPGPVDLRGRVVGGLDRGGTVGQSHLGAGEGDLEHVSGEVERRVVEALRPRWQAEARRVVVDPDVGGDQPAVGGVAEVAERHPTVGTEDRRCGLDLELEAQAPRRQPVGVLHRREHAGERLDVLTCDDLREGDDEAVGQLARGVEQGPHEPVERRDAAAREPVGERLHPDPDERRRVPVGDGGRDGGGRGGHVPGLGLRRASEVAVLRITAQVLDRFVGQLRDHPLVDAVGERPVHGPAVHLETAGPGERRPVGRVRLQQPQRRRPVPGRRVGADPVERDVEDLDRLAGRGDAGPRAVRLRVGLLDPGEQPVDRRRVQRAAAHQPGSGVWPSRTTVPSMTPNGRSATRKTAFGLSSP
jgi:hypothetical protein